MSSFSNLKDPGSSEGAPEEAAASGVAPDSWCFRMILFLWLLASNTWQCSVGASTVLRKSQEAVHLAMQKCGSLALLEVILGPTVLSMSVTHVTCYAENNRANGVLEEQTLACIGVAIWPSTAGQNR